MLTECKGDGNADVGAGRGVVAMSLGCEYMRGTRGLGIVSTADDVLEMIRETKRNPLEMAQTFTLI